MSERDLFNVSTPMTEREIDTSIFHDILLLVILGQPSEIYLRSLNYKRLFARKRMRYLKRVKAKYIRKERVPVEGNNALIIRRAEVFATLRQEV